ncbi:MAG: type II secretion system F family protein, partial [Candidatus Eremiobacterota bacterium]
MHFTRQLATLIQAGIPLTRTLQSLAHPAWSPPGLSEALQQINRGIDRGERFSACLGRYPGIFGPVYRSLIKIGEETGALHTCVGNLANWLEREDRLRRSVFKALTYPAFLLTLTLLLAGLVYTTVLPGFLPLLTESGASLPWTTRILMTVVSCLRAPGFWMLAATLFVAALSAVKEKAASLEGRQALARRVLAVPVLGPLVREAWLARYSSAMQLLLATGVSLVESVRLAGQASGNPLLEADAAVLRRRMVEGESLHAHLASRRDLYPGTMAHLVQVGEQAGGMDS